MYLLCLLLACFSNVIIIIIRGVASVEGMDLAFSQLFERKSHSLNEDLCCWVPKSYISVQEKRKPELIKMWIT